MQETKQFWDIIWERREHKRKFKWINNIKKESQGLEESPKAKIHLDSLGVTLKKVPNSKTSSHVGLYGFWFIKFTSIHNWQSK